MIIRSLLLSALFIFLGYSVRLSRERFDRRTIKVFVHVGHHCIEPVTVAVHSKAYDVLCETDRSYKGFGDTVLNTLRIAESN